MNTDPGYEDVNFTFTEREETRDEDTIVGLTDRVGNIVSFERND